MIAEEIELINSIVKIAYQILFDNCIDYTLRKFSLVNIALYINEVQCYVLFYTYHNI